jgi:hypothetical protein
MAVTESPHTGPENMAHGYCIALYDAMKARAVKGVFTGSFTEVYKTLGISNQYYSKCTKALVDIGSVEHIQRGHHKRPTIYKLIHRPTKAQLDEYDFLTPRTRRARVSEEELLQRLQKLERSVGGVDIVAALTNLEQRIVALEKGDGR